MVENFQNFLEAANPQMPPNRYRLGGGAGPPRTPPRRGALFSFKRAPPHRQDSPPLKILGLTENSVKLNLTLEIQAQKKERKLSSVERTKLRRDVSSAFARWRIVGAKPRVSFNRRRMIHVYFMITF